MSDHAAELDAGKTRLSAMTVGAGAAALAAGLGGFGLLEAGSRSGIEGGILLLVAALGLLAVAIGGRPYGPAVEGALDLSARLGLGVLGGVLAGLVHGLLTEAAGSVGLTLLLGVGVDVDLSAGQYLMRAAYGAVWGIFLGAVYPAIPGRGFAARGVAFSLLPSVYTLFVVYPVLLGLGFLGVRQGFLTFPLVLVGYAVAGMVAAWVISWGGETDLAPVSAPLVE
jgi:hypothetical protein